MMIHLKVIHKDAVSLVGDCVEGEAEIKALPGTDCAGKHFKDVSIPTGFHGRWGGFIITGNTAPVQDYLGAACVHYKDLYFFSRSASVRGAVNIEKDANRIICTYITQRNAGR